MFVAPILIWNEEEEETRHRELARAELWSVTPHERNVISKDYALANLHSAKSTYDRRGSDIRVTRPCLSLPANTPTATPFATLTIPNIVTVKGLDVKLSKHAYLQMRTAEKNIESIRN